MMKSLSRIPAVVACIVLAYFALIFGASESGEVVQLTTQDASGDDVTTRLWVTDHDGAMWLRADSGSGWYQRLIFHDIQAPAMLRRGDVSYLITVAASPEMVSTLNVLMADKYGLGDTIVGALGGGESSTGVALKVILVD
ncbi:MAG TPA: hypothetical protein DE147_03730 [Gammaproteobacteria bacterium]|nr:hypothetical protein [Gammaproteobacteria bacterium]